MAAVTTPASINSQAAQAPWYSRVTCWGQMNITAKDPATYDVEWWRKFWKRTETRGVIINVAGIVAYYPTRIPLHHQAEYFQNIAVRRLVEGGGSLIATGDTILFDEWGDPRQ